MSRKLGLISVLATATVFALCGCGGGGGSTPPPPPVISVGLAPSAAQAIDLGQSVNFTANVANDSKSAGVSWSQTGLGALSGQTTTAATYTAPTSGAAGTASVTATSVTDPTKNASVNITISLAPVITTTSLPNGTVGTAYPGGAGIVATGGTGALTYSISSGALPTGLSLNATTGAITGTPTGAPGTANFTAKVTDSSTAAVPGSATQALTILINPATLQITTTSPLTNGSLNSPYSATLQSTGGTGQITWSLITGTLPTGLSLNATTGVISGTPTEAISADLTFQAADSGTPQQSVQTSLNLTIDGTTLAITTTSLLNPLVGESYSQTLQFTGGTAPFTWSVLSGTLPAGLSLDSSTGTITGTPTATSGPTSITFQLTD